MHQPEEKFVDAGVFDGRKTLVSQCLFVRLYQRHPVDQVAGLGAEQGLSALVDRVPLDRSMALRETQLEDAFDRDKL